MGDVIIDPGSGPGNFWLVNSGESGPRPTPLFRFEIEQPVLGNNDLGVLGIGIITYEALCHDEGLSIPRDHKAIGPR